jgi:flagellar biosynthetic protein FliP
MLTCFTRIIIALHFLRSALGTQQMPPNQVMIGLALFLTFFIMSPTLSTINTTAIIPYAAGTITQQEAIDTGLQPLRSFMIRQVEKKDVALFASLANETYQTPEEIPNTVLIPSFILGEISKGFRFGFFIYMPFIVVDMVVASTLMAMGMMMLPPAMISLPFKVLLFVMVDGWNLVIEYLIKTFK